MSDYLGNLLARSLGPSEEIRPRVPSLFEPLPGPALTGQPGGLEAASESPASISSPTLQPAPARVEPGGSPRYRAAAESVLERTPAGLLFPATAKPLGPLVATPTPAFALSAVLSSDTATPDHSPKEPRHEGTGSVALASEPPSPSSIADRIDELKHDSASPRSLPISPALPPTASPGVFQTNAAGNGIVVRPFSPLREAASLSARDLAPAPAAHPPAIHVTIGRIEVRATTAAAGPRPKSRYEPALTLDAYLAGRAKGGRR